MDYAEFEISLQQTQPPQVLNLAQQALWYAYWAESDQSAWHQAHRCAQQDGSVQAAWVHAHLHRIEGDLSNARYWYNRAGKAIGSGSARTEWEQIAHSLFD